MDDILCRACMAPQGKIKHNSIFSENGKIAKEIFKLTRLVIIDITEVNCPAVICQRCLMDLERAISFRDLVIKTERQFKEISNSKLDQILETFYKKLKNEERLRKLGKTCRENLSKWNKKDTKIKENIEKESEDLVSIVKEEKFEFECVKSKAESEGRSDKNSQNEPQSKKSEANSDKINEKPAKIRQKVTKMREFPPNLGENSEKLTENFSNFYKTSTNLQEDSEEDEKNIQKYEPKDYPNLEKVIKKEWNNHRKFSQNVVNLQENSDLFPQNSDGFPENLDELQQNLDKFAQNSVEIIKIGENIDKFRQKPDIFGQNAGNIGQIAGNFGQSPENLSHSIENFGHNPKKIRLYKNFGRISEQFDETSKSFERNPEIFSRNSANFDQEPESFDHNLESFSQNTDDYYQTYQYYLPNPQNSYQIDHLPSHNFQITNIQKSTKTSFQGSSQPKKRKSVPQLPIETATNKLQCKICSKKFSRKCYLTQHFQTIHMDFKPHKCIKCGKRYATLEDLKHHEEKHVADKPFKCQICEKSFIHKADLKRHAISHLDDKPFQCEFCSRGFVRNDHLAKHVRVHQRKMSKAQKVVKGFGGGSKKNRQEVIEMLC